MSKKIRIIPWLDTGELNKQLDQLGKRQQKIKVDIDNANINNADKSLQQMNKTVANSNSVFGNLKNTIGKFSHMASPALLIMKTFNEIKQAASFTKELDSALTNINYTMEVSAAQLEKIGQKSIIMAKDLNTSAENVLGAVKLYANAKETADSILEKAQPAIMLSNVTGFSGEQSAKYLQTIMNQFDLAQDDLMNISDIVQGVSQSIAHDFADGIVQINEGIETSGEVARTAGMDLAEYASMIGLLVERTGLKGSQLGNSIKTIITRTTKAGKILGIDEGEISDAEKSLRNVGIAVRETDGEFRDFKDTMRDLSEVWDTLSDVEKSNIAFNLAGTRQINVIQTLLRNWSDYEDLVVKANESAGVTFENQEKYAESLQGRMEELSATMTSVRNNLINEGNVSPIVDIISNLAKGLDVITSKLGLIGTLGTGAGLFAGIKNIGIFRTITDDATKANKSVKLFGISFKNAIDTKAVELYNAEIEKGTAAQEALEIASKGTNKATIALMQSTNGATVSTEQLTAAQKASTLAAKAQSIALKAVSVAGNMLIFMAISKGIQFVTSAIDDLVHSEENLRQSASELGSELSSNTSDIDGYKKKIDELKSVISDSSSSFEDVSQARVNLMTIQDELIDKFGNEQGAIENITAAINDQTDALDELSRQAYYKAVNKFNEKSNGEKFANWLSFGNTNDDRVQSKMDRMVSTMQSSMYELETTGNEVLDNLIAKSYGLNIVDNMYGNGQHFQLYGTLDEIQNKLYGIQRLSQDFDLSTGFENSFTTISNDVDDALVKYKSLYDQYVLYEKILTNNPENQYDEQFDLINKAREAYTEALKSNDANEIKEAADAYSQTLQSAIDLAMGNYDYDVADYFEGMYPELQQMFGEWKFNLKFEPNTDGLKDKVTNALDSIDGVSDGITSFSVDDINNFNPKVATQEQIDAYADLKNVADEYGLSLAQLISLLQTMGLVQSESYQQLVDTFGQENVDTLTPEDIEIAYTIENAGEMTFDELKAEIQRTKDEANGITAFSAFSDTQLGERIQHVTQLFNEGKLSHKQYFDALQSEINNFDASNFTNSIEDANKAAGQFFVDSVQQTANGLSTLINSFDSGKMSISEYLEGYLSIGDTLSTLTDSLQENAAEWNEHGNAISDSENEAIDNVQNKLQSAMSTIESYQDSIYSLEQILSDSVTEGTDEFTAHANVIADDLARIVETGGEMADEVASTLGTTTDEIAQSLTENVDNQYLACQAIMTNTNSAITDMAESIGDLFDTLGNEIANFKVDLTFTPKFETFKTINILGHEFDIPKIKFELSASGESLSNIGAAISSFGKTISNNLGAQTIDLDDFLFGNTDAAKDSNYSPSSDVTDHFNDELKKLKDAAGKSGKEAGDAYVEAFEKELEELERLRDNGVITEKEFLEQYRRLYEKYFKGIDKYAKEFYDHQVKYLQGMKSLYEDALSGITKLIDDQIDDFESAKDDAISFIEEERDAALEAIEAQIKAKQKIIDGIQSEIDAMREANEERKRQINLQQAQYNLAKMQAQRTKLVYSEEKGLHYEVDYDAIRDAKEKLDDAKLEIEIANKEKQISLLEKEIDLLEERKDSTNEYYDKLIADTEKYWDELIKNMEDYKSRWEELAEIEERAKIISTLEQLGITTEDILNMSGEAFEKFKGEYVGILADLYRDNDSMTNALAQSLGTTTDKLGSYIQATQGYIDSLGGSAESIQPVSDAINNALSSMDNLSGSASSAGSSVSDTASNLNDAATSAGTLSSNLNDVNTAISEEQTAFGNLKSKIDEVIQAINDKIEAIQEEQRTVGIATSSEIADFILLKNAILEVKETITELDNTVTDLDSQTLDNITNSFQQLYDKIILVSGALGSGIEGSVEGVTNSISSAIKALNNISLEEGIIAQFNNLKTAIDSVTSALSGGGGKSSGGQSQGGQSSASSSGSESGSKGGVANSLLGAITEMGTTANEVIGEPKAEGDGTVIGEFGSLKTAVDNVSEAIGIGSDDGSGGSGTGGGQDDDGTLIGSINDLGTTTNETLGETGGDGVIGRFEEFSSVIAEAEDHVQGINQGLDEIDGKEVECTITINVKQNGSASGLGMVTGSAMNLNSATYNAKLEGASHLEGTALVQGNWAVQSEEKNALLAEIGPEIVVRDGRYHVIGLNGAEMFHIKPGDIVFNAEQSAALLKYGKISGRGKAYADGTVGDPFASGKLRPLQPGDRAYELQQKMNDYLAKMGGDTASLLAPVNAMQKNMEQMTQALNTVNNINNSNNRMQNVVNEFHITMPNVTDSTAATELMKDLQSLGTKKMQFFD